MITKDFVESLGWRFDDYWNNRAMFSLNEKSPYSIFEHNGDWGIMDPLDEDFALIYCDMTTSMIKTFTELAKKLDDMVEHPKNYSLYDYAIAKGKMEDFVKKMRDRA